MICGAHEPEVGSYKALLHLVRPAAGTGGTLSTACMPFSDIAAVHDVVS